MKFLDERVLYVDTDSIFYIRILDLYTPNLGDFLGEFTNEIDPQEGDHIIEFVSAGPKNYSFKLKTGITHYKDKGFSLNFKAAKKIDYDRIKQIVCHMREERINITQSTIVRDKTDWSLKIKLTDKVYRWCTIKEKLEKIFLLFLMAFKKFNINFLKKK
jgi:hypothetical protein